jgi:hypothetical protein
MIISVSFEEKGTEMGAGHERSDLSGAVLHGFRTGVRRFVAAMLIKSVFFVHSLPALVKHRDVWRSLVAASVFAVFVLLGSVPAGAAEESHPDRIMLRIGGYQVRNADTLMRLDANDLPVGGYIDFHDTLGGDTTATLFRLDGLYRFNEKHSLGFSWYDIKFSGSRVLSKQIEWGGQTYPISTHVDSELRYDIYKLNYQYSLFHNDTVEVGASLGLHIMKIFTGISASGIQQSSNHAATAPLPVFGLFTHYNFTSRLSAFYHYQWFFINYQDRVKGGLQDFLLGVEYRIFRNVSLGAAYNRFAMDVKVKGDNATLNLTTKWNGGMLYGALYF